MLRLAGIAGPLLVAAVVAAGSAAEDSVAALQALERELGGLPPAAALVRLESLIADAEARGESADALQILRAGAFLRLGRPAAAETVLAPLATRYPDAGRIQLDHAFALFLLQRDEEARTILLRVGAQEDLPKPVQRNIEDLLAEIRARARFRLDLDVSLWHDTNVNNAPEIETVGVAFAGSTLPLRLHQQPVEAWVARTAADVHWRSEPPPGSRFTLRVHGGAARSTAVGASEHNRTAVRSQAGVRRAHALDFAGIRRPGGIRADIGVERHWRGGQGFSATAWTGLSAQQSLSARWQAELAAHAWKTWHDGQPAHVDPDAFSLRAFATRGLRRGQLTLGLGASRERPERPFLRSRAVELSADTLLRFGSDWTVRAWVRSAWSRHDARQPLFGVLRRDSTLGARVGISHRDLSVRGYLPELTFGLSRTASTIDLYDRDAASVSVTVSRLF